MKITAFLASLAIAAEGAEVELELTKLLKTAQAEYCKEQTQWCRQATAFLDGEAPTPEDLLKPTVSRELNQGAHLALLTRREGVQTMVLLFPLKAVNEYEQQQTEAYIKEIESGKVDPRNKASDFVMQMATMLRWSSAQRTNRSLCFKDFYGPGNADVVVRKKGKTLYALRVTDIEGKKTPVFAEFPLPVK